MGLSRTWCQSGEFVLECEKGLSRTWCQSGECKNIFICLSFDSLQAANSCCNLVILVYGSVTIRVSKVCQNWPNLQLVQFTEFPYYR